MYDDKTYDDRVQIIKRKMAKWLVSCNIKDLAQKTLIMQIDQMMN